MTEGNGAHQNRSTFAGLAPLVATQRAWAAGMARGARAAVRRLALASPRRATGPVPQAISANELDRLIRRQFWLKLFWMVVTVGLLIFCLASASARTTGLFATWRGAALLLLSAAYAWRVGWPVWRSWFHPRLMLPSAEPWHAMRVWGVTLLLTLALFALDPIMGWLCYPLFGMAFTMFEMPLAVAPGLVSFLLIPATVVANGYATIAELATPGSLGGWALAFGGYGALTYWPAKMMRDRIRREISMAELEQVHGELQQAHRELEASAEREREMAVLRERGRLARDMHDTLGHALVLIAVKLEAARRLREVDAVRADHELEVTQQIVRDAMTELRASLAALRSPVLERESPGRMLAEFAHEAGQRAGWHVIYDVATDLGDLDEETREALLRVGAEALTNVERHAHARTVTVTLKREGESEADGSIVLRVTDDGVGLAHQEDSAAPLVATGYGITGMRERITALGGRLSVGHGAARGTVVEARIPALAAQHRPQGEPPTGITTVAGLDARQPVTARSYVAGE